MAEYEEQAKAESRWRQMWPLIRVMIAAGFAFSCFGLLLFVWTTFGGIVPLKAKSYRFTADFTEGISLQKETDVRVGGVSVGKVKDVALEPDTNATKATIELDPSYAPISSDAHAILRMKTLLGESYIELTTGSQNPYQGGETAQVGSTDSLVGDHAEHPIPEDGHLANSQVSQSVQIDEIFNALDEPTRNSFRLWQQNLAQAAAGRGLDLNDAFGNLGPFANDTNDILATLHRQDSALSQLVNSTGQVFGALTERDRQLQSLVTGNDRTFGALAARDKQLAESIKIFPTFNSEARKTISRLARFSTNAAPFARNLKPVARNLTPTLRDVRKLSPHLQRLFTNLDPLITASLKGLPALRGVLHEARPVLKNLDPFLANLNPIIRYTGLYSGNVKDFLADPETTQAGMLTPLGSQPSARHAFRQISYISPETLSIYPNRLASNRGNGYVPPFGLLNLASANQSIRFESHDCLNTGATGGLGSGQVSQNPPSNPPTSAGSYPLLSGFASCVLAPAFAPPFSGAGNVPYVTRDP
jgi:phospholipid/cholesterol/gamma-HCH transport system substrate-binding protein